MGVRLRFGPVAVPEAGGERLRRVGFARPGETFFRSASTSCDFVLRLGLVVLAEELPLVLSGSFQMSQHMDARCRP